jgi:hypothetical protein
VTFKLRRLQVINLDRFELGSSAASGMDLCSNASFARAIQVDPLETSHEALDIGTAEVDMVHLL